MRLFLSVSPKFDFMNELFTFATLMACLLWPISAATAQSKDDTNDSRIVVGGKLADLNSLSWSTVIDGQIQPATNVKNDRLRLVVLCDLQGVDLKLGLPDFVQKLPQSTDRDVQVCVLFSASQQQMSDLLAKRIPLDRQTYGDLFSKTFLLTGDDQQLLGLSVLRANGLFPGLEAKYLNRTADLRIPTLLLGQSGVIEWVGDLTLADRPTEQLIAGTWDRSITELASQLSETLFFEMRFFVEVGGTLEELRKQCETDKRGRYTLREGAAVDKRMVGKFVGGLQYVPELNVAKPLLLCMEAEAKGERQLAIDCLVESLLAVNFRVITLDQYWADRPVWSFLESLQKTIQINQQVAKLVDDEVKKKLDAQQQSLRQTITLLQAAEAGDFRQVNSRIEEFSDQERQENRFGFLRCQIDACVKSGSAEAGVMLNQLLAQLPISGQYTQEFYRLREYSRVKIMQKLLAGEQCSQKVRAIAKGATTEDSLARNLKNVGSVKLDMLNIISPESE